MRPRLVLLMLPLSLSIVASGCISPRDNEVGESFLSNADTICRQLNKDLDTLPTPVDITGFVAYLEDVESVEKQIRLEVDALERPQGDEEAIESVLNAAAERISVMGKLGVAARAQDSAQSFDLAVAFVRESNSLVKQARSLGLDVCFQDERAGTILDEGAKSLIPTTTISTVPVETVPAEGDASVEGDAAAAIDDTVAPS